MSHLIGVTLRNRYKIFQCLGGGGFGDTYLARDLDLPGQPECVVKHLKPKDSSPAVLAIAKKLFEREAQTLYRLGNAHNQIPKLSAHFEENGEFYLVQEFVDGHDLTKEIIPGSPKNEQVVFKLLKDILEVLAFVHQQNVIHRDIKPANLMRRRQDGKIVLIDFGAVKEISALKLNAQGESSLTAPIGTRGYAPIEQHYSRPQLSSDIYAVGIIGFGALTGLHPKQLPRDANNGELYCALFPDKINISPSFAQILDTMVRNDCRQRYQNATDALEALQQYLDISQAPTFVQPPPAVTPISPDPPAETPIVQKIWQFFRQLFGESAPTPNNPQASTTIAPQPAATFGSFEQPEGQVSLQSAFYVERPPTEADCYETILQPGALIRIKAPRQMGKTSLLTRVLDHGKQHGCQTAYLNFQSADAEFFTSLDKFLQWFCGSIAQNFELENKLTEYWQGVLGSKDKCTNYFQRYLLSEIHSPIVLGLDEVDQVFQYPQVASEFFGLLRAWHETSKNNENWKKLRLVIVHSKEVYIPLNINQSPFNVGLPIELPEFNSSQVQDLVQRDKLNWTQEEINQLMAMLGGHPYLVRKALHEIARDRISLSQLLKIAPTEEGFYNDHLRRHLMNLQEDSKLVAAIKQVVAVTQPVRVETGLAFKLRSMGLVKFQGNDVMPLCDLYRLYFREHLGVN
ncbi:AAA-like domain-containing protein [Brasilonema sp. CT11]|nr:AAA-like domain-containing protein [Brasilonema sp. CT11]